MSSVHEQRTALTEGRVRLQIGSRDRIGVLCEHVLKQGTLYPSFPPAVNSCVDFAHWQHLQLAFTPDVLVLPSQLAPCAKALTQTFQPSTSGMMPR
jgi:hypothetical protein